MFAMTTQTRPTPAPEPNDPIVMNNRLDVLRRQTQISQTCPDRQLARLLAEDATYGSPAAFWARALAARLVNQAEYDRAPLIHLTQPVRQVLRD
jgi:hypothetical protein